MHRKMIILTVSLPQFIKQFIMRSWRSVFLPSKFFYIDGSTEVLSDLMDENGNVNLLIRKGKNRKLTDLWDSYALDLLHWLNLQTKFTSPEMKHYTAPSYFRSVDKIASEC